MIKNKNLYLPSGYLDFNSVIDDDYPIALVIGGRGTGKSYGALQYAAEHYLETGRSFIYMRRTKTQADVVATDVFNPYKPINSARGWTLTPFSVSKGIYGFYESFEDPETGRVKPAGNYYGIIASLSTFSNFRGFDASNIDLIIYDEFIKNKGEKSIKDEGFALMNVYETVNRNRELNGQKAVKLVCLSNSNAIDNDIFIDWEIVSSAEFMIQRNKTQYYDEDRHLAIYNLSDSKISESKRGTVLYQLDAGGSYSDMALANKYEDYDLGSVKSEPLNEYKLLVQVGEIYVYQHKAENRYYASFHRSGTAPKYENTSIDVTRFIRKYSYLWEAYLNERIRFESFLCKKVFEKIFI